MPPIEITSTTDSPEAVRAAMGLPATGESAAEGGEHSSAPAEKTPEQNEALTSESEAKDDKESKTAESEGAEADEANEPKETDDEEPEKDEAKPKAKKGFQRRVEKLNQRINAAQQEAEYWRREALKNATAREAPEKTDTAKPADTEGRPKADDFETHEAFVEALTDWKVDQAEKKRAERETKSRAETEAQRIDREHATRVQSFREKHDDFDEVLQEGLSDLSPSPALEHVIKSSDHGPELLYALAKDPKEAARIARLVPMALAKEIGKLEARIATEASAAKTQSPNKITNAPKPLSPVTARGGKTEKSPDEMSYQEFKKWREAQLKTRRS